MTHGMAAERAAAISVRDQDYIRDAMPMRPVVGYAVPIVAVLLSTGVKWFAGSYLDGVTFSPFFLAVLASGFAGGWRGGALATLLSVASTWFFFLGPYLSFEFDLHVVVSLLVFILISAMILLVIVRLRQTVERVSQQELRQRSLIESAPNGIIVVGKTGVIIAVNARAENLFGLSRAELIGQSIEILVPRKFASVHKSQREAFQKAPETRPMGVGRDLWARRKDGNEFPVEIGLSPLVWDDQPTVLATITDITERKQQEERQKVLAKELEHRVGNFFALILAIIRRTLRRGRSVVEAEQALTQRVHSFAKVHAMISEAHFRKVSLDNLLSAAAEGFDEQIESTGVDVPLKAAPAQALAFIFNELVASAIQHGALSSSSGRVAISKEIMRCSDKDCLVFNWKESGGPGVSADAQKGFGRFILEESPKQFGGTGVSILDPQGLAYRLMLPLAEVADLEKASG